MRPSRVLVLALFGALWASRAAAQPKKPAPKGPPTILVSQPLGVRPGGTTRLVLRGLKIDAVKEVRCLPRGSVKVLKKAKVAVSNQQSVKRVGDCQVEVELTVPADVPGEAVSLVAVTPEGESQPRPVLLDRGPTVAEKEPNDGFKQAQAIDLGPVVQGVIGQPQDVDVYRFEGKAGQQVVVEVFAARHGSALDSVLTLYDARGQVVASCDDLEDTTDSRLEVTLPRAGVYYASVLDAHDQGGPAHVYRLSVRPK